MRSVPLVFPAGKPVPVWRADQIDCAAGGAAARPSGHAALDAELPGGGWPAGGLIELLLPAPGCGELRLLAPALAGASLLWIAPPFTPYAPALAGLGLALERLTIVTPANAADAAWAAEQALRAGALSVVLWWQGEAHSAALPATLRRLHLAAEEGRTPLFALRPAAMRAQSSPAPLRLALEPAPLQASQVSQGLSVKVFKRRGPPMAAPLVLPLPGPALRRSRQALQPLPREPRHAVVRPAPERAAA